MKKTILFGMLLLAATTVSAQFVHIELKNGEKYDYDSKDIKTMTVDTKQPVKKVEGTATVGDKTYTLTVGGTVADYVDLGLPSGTLWASHNIGASQPEEYGAYLAWAEVGAKEEGYVDGVKQKDGNSYYAFNNLKYSTSTSSTYSEYDKFTKYVASSSYGTVDNKKVLEAMDDAATVNWGDGWRMPTRAEQDELRNSCTWTWVTTDVKDASGNFIKGYKVTGPNGNYIFLPAAGWRRDGSLGNVGSYGYYWSSSLSPDDSDCAYELNFNSSDVDWYDSLRFLGQSVRLVRSE